MSQGHPRPPTGPERRAVDEVIAGVLAGDIDAVLDQLAPDAVLVSDGGSMRSAARRPVVGAERVARFLTRTGRTFARAKATPATVNGDPGLIVELDGQVEFVAAFEVEDDHVATIWIMRNPDKLAHLGSSVALA